MFLILSLLSALFITHVFSLRKRPRRKATSVWDAGVTARLNAPEVPEDARIHPNETHVEVLTATVGDLVNIEVSFTA